ncbi:hypothetical protein NP493_644g04011 [Ridgeia piscesae]|uniref:Reverse transcriptase domain-containing protein n=1 Tax=Ridgeia piscesae TaxID=27915 RepID=A0AAD9KSW8_RIDPI|nr:hypothetical protein NP493_644g04011 [Ridgeia piscesae]
MTTRFAIVGDFNIHWDVPSDTNVKRFADLLESLNIIQHVHAPTHIDGHTIDLILTPSGNHAITSTKTTLLLFDHLGVEYLVDMEKPVVPRKTITYRKYKAINKPVFCSDIALSLPTAISSGKQTTELANHYNVVLTKLIEKHAPLQTCRIADRPLVPWCNKNVIKAKQIRRQCERKWRHTSLQVHRDLYKTQCAEVKRTIIKAKSDYYTSEIEQCGCDNRRLYRLLNGLLQRRKSHYLPVNNNIHELALRFSTFFSAKIETIRVAFHSHSTLASSSTRDHRPAPWVSRLELFPTATSDIHSLLIKSPTTSCVLDPLPTWLLKDDDILGARDRRFGVILVLLDMSAAFDTVNHEILLSRLEHRYGMAGSVLAWMRSYLTDRSQCVYLQGGASSKTGVACGVPQGSVLGPLLFSVAPIVKQRVQYSILLLVFRAQHRLAPPYITDLLVRRATRVLRSTTNNDFYVPPSRSRYGDRMFSVAGPRLWNSLPAEIKKTCCIVTFKTIENPPIPGCV